jgi:hypothetical protein
VFGCLLGVAVVECLQALLDVYAAVVAVYTGVEGYGCLHCKKGYRFSRPHSPAGMSQKLNSPWPGIIKLFISVGC